MTAATPGSSAQRGLMFRLTLLASLLTVITLAWAVRNEKFYSPGDNFGYYLGVIGGIMILTLLLYPLRKYVRFMSSWGATKHWFRLHMIFGIAGPTFILFHSTFHIGSLNAAIALYCMLLVAGSGVIGRFIYRKIHHGLYGRSATLQEIQTRLGISQGDVKSKFHFAKEVEQHLKEFETWAITAHTSGWARAWQFISAGPRARWAYFQVARELDRALRAQAAQQTWDEAKLNRRLQRGKNVLWIHLSAVIDVARFRAYEQLFSLWHILHVPFVFMLVISGVVHVIAVHMY